MVGMFGSIRDKRNFPSSLQGCLAHKTTPLRPPKADFYLFLRLTSNTPPSPSKRWIGRGAISVFHEYDQKTPPPTHDRTKTDLSRLRS